MGMRLPRCEDTESEGIDMLTPVASTLVGRIETTVPRFAEPGPRNPALEAGEMLYREMGVGRVVRGAARPLILRDELGGGPAPESGRHSLAFFAAYSDFQLVDDESPVRLSSLDNAAIPAGLRSQEAYLPRALSAMNETFARIESEGRPFDFGIITGDCADNAQANELRWVIELMNGAEGIETDSGADDDPVMGPDNDPKDPFDAVAFPAPWLYVPGNHDVEVIGIYVPNDVRRAAAIGTDANSGTRDYTRWYAPPTRGQVVADPERHIVERDEIVSALLADTAGAGPVGHGYVPGADTTLGANYVYDAIPGLLRIVALDTSDRTGGSEGLVLRTTVDGFLIPALEEAAADGVLVMLASHHSTSSIDTSEGQLGGELAGAVPAAELETIVASHEAVIAWLVGHSHDNRIRAVGHDDTHRGYWEIMTAALADWPGQARTVELVDNGDGTLSIFSVTIDFDADDCFERRFRHLLAMEFVSAWVEDVSDDDRNHDVEMLIDIPLSAADAVRAAAIDASTDIVSLTSLRGR
jgi:hypothetical protein